VENHCGRDGEHQDQIDSLGVQNLHGRHMEERTGDEVKESPTTTDGGTRKHAVPLTALQYKSRSQDADGQHTSHDALADGPQRPQLISQKQHKTRNESDDAELV
jgi:hypothetical protein